MRNDRSPKFAQFCIVAFLALGFGVCGAMLGSYVGGALIESTKSAASQAHHIFVPPAEAVLGTAVGLLVRIAAGGCLGLVVISKLRKGDVGRVFEVLLESAFALSGAPIGVFFFVVAACVGIGSGLYSAHVLVNGTGTVRSIVAGVLTGLVLGLTLAWTIPWSWYTAIELVGDFESVLCFALAIFVPIPTAVVFYECSK